MDANVLIEWCDVDANAVIEWCFEPLGCALNMIALGYSWPVSQSDIVAESLARCGGM